ncbi:hypothetical protein [Comamonas endophytica]|uniref:Mercuric ion transport protein n=1 Tax=Comamonas endophytica TaxID=2949090 RepID=A0ABY6GF89_9BURK|nr:MULTISPECIES: hypothetical protein [unclassified Acidovorax]MCD2514468.1 hypothetical protein [Acidovorax sp. D4N7]UYG53757.1 hypothetical protein M9799_17635 [Acidovorax sp. 5MLIR]
MKFPLLLACLLLAPLQALACSPCRTMVVAGVLDAHFALRLLLLTVPVLLLVAFAVWMYRTQEAPQ